MLNKSNIVLIGFMGCGKSTIGEELAKKIRYSFIDSDIEIEKKLGMSISDFFSRYGESKFRVIEEEVIAQIALKTKGVIATGGGIVKSSKNISALKANGTIIYLKASPGHIYENVKNDTSRPLLNTGNKLETIKRLLDERNHLYENACNFAIHIDDKSIDDIIISILDNIRG